MALDPQQARFAMLFRGLPRAHGIYELLSRKNGGKKIQGKARTVRAPVTEDLWAAHFNGKQGLGIVPINDDCYCWFGAIDVDRYDLNMAEVEAGVAKLGFPLLPTRTKSGGVHLYAFGKVPLPSPLFRRKLAEWSVALGYGGAEVFPKQDELMNDSDVGNWINMPYFGASTGQTERYGVLHGEPLDLGAFCDRAEQLQLTVEILEAIDAAPAEEFLEGPPCLQSLSAKGFDEGKRNNGMTAVVVYLKKRYPDDWKNRVADYNNKFFKPPLPQNELNTIIKSMSRKDYNYSCDTAPCKQFCNRQLCITRDFGVGKGVDNWNISIDSDVQMIMTQPPYLMLTVNGVRMSFFSQELLQQRKFQDKCYNTIRYAPPMLAADKWLAIVNKALTDATEIEAPPDAGSAGELAYHLQQFCNPDAHPHGETRSEILTGKPYTEDGWVYFKSNDFRMYLEARHFKAFTGAKLFAELRAIGVEHRQLKIGDAGIHVWCVKASATIPVEVTARKTAGESM